MSYRHAAVWLDHQRAHVVRFDSDNSETANVHAHGGERHLHHKRGALGAGHAPENPDYYESVAGVLSGVESLLIMGPASAKDAFVRHLEARHPQLRKAVAGVENADHPTDGEILAHARRWFKGADRLRPGAGMKLPK